MRQTVYLVLLFLFLTSFTLKKNEVLIYYIPFENFYLISKTVETAKSCNDVQLRLTENKKLVKSLASFINKVDTCKVAKEYNYIDIRVVLAFLVKNERKEIGIDQFGMFMYKSKVYEKNDFLIKIIEKHNSYIKWE